MKRILWVVCLLLVMVLGVSACSGAPNGQDISGLSVPSAAPIANMTESYQYDQIVENEFASPEKTETSYFSLDRNTASYTYMRREISNGIKPSEDAVRLEEYVNYFSYNYARPAQGEQLALSGGLFDCPWNDAHKLFTIGVAAEEVEMSSVPNNIVFLIDVSGSMYGDDRLGLIQQAFTMLLENLTENDCVSIVTYASGVRTALDGARGSEKTQIANILQDLEAGGSTNGEGGIQLAYEVAQKHFISNGNNRVILATDGDFNVGISNKNDLKNLISEKRESGIFLSVLGVGMLNTNDSTMNTLATNGNGNYAYLDSVAEARKVLVNEIGGTFNVVAKDAKIGVTFNKDVVASYRLIGYESKMMSEDEFNDQNKDAGEIGSGHTVTAVYEVELKPDAEGEIATAELRYKVPGNDDAEDESKSISKTYTTADYTALPNEDSTFIGCVVEYGLVLRNSQYKNDATLTAVKARLETLQSVAGEDADQFRAEFLKLVEQAIDLYC